MDTPPNPEILPDFPPQVDVSEREQEPRNPEALALEDSGIPHALGYATKDVERRPLEAEGMKRRPLHLREWRAEQANEFYAERNNWGNRMRRLFGKRTENPSRGVRKEVHEEQERRDRVAEEFLRQGTVTVHAYGGDISARYTVLQPPMREGKEAGNLPPVVFIPGISNDLASVAPLAQEIAHAGRTVIVIGQPESKMGHVTDEFAGAAEQAKAFEPHVEFFQEAIRALRQKVPSMTGDVEMWGHSAGCPMIAQMLQEGSSFPPQVSRAVLINPSASVALPVPAPQSPLGKAWSKLMGPLNWIRDPINRGILRDLKGFIRRSRPIPDILVTGRRQDGHVPQEEPEDTARRDRTFQAVLAHLRVPYEGYDTMHMRGGAGIVLVTCDRDSMTHAGERFTAQQHPANMRVMAMKGGHSEPLIEPEAFVRAIEQHQ
ncbi:MAG: alpha/beta hydrolase [Patescibacteria group bacterium]